MGVGTGGQRRLAVLRTLADLAVPSVAPPCSGEADPAFWARRASDLDIADAVAGTIATRLQPRDAAGLTELLHALAKLQVHRLPGPIRGALLAGLRRASADAARGLDALRTITLLLFYGLADAEGTNPNWAAVGYPGPSTMTTAFGTGKAPRVTAGLLAPHLEVERRAPAAASRGRRGSRSCRARA